MSIVQGVLLGNYLVGKTALIHRARSGFFDREAVATIGASHVSLDVESQGQRVTFQMRDTTGADHYKNMVTLFFRGAQIALLVFSVTDQKSFDDLDDWNSRITGIEPGCEVALIGSKIDVVEERVVSGSLAEEKSRQLGCVFYHETSALTGEGVADLFLGFMDSPAVQARLQGERLISEQEYKPVDIVARAANQKTSSCWC